VVNFRLFGSTCLLFLFLPALLPASDRTGFITSSDSVKIYYQEEGSGEPLLLIPGGPGDSHTYFKPYFDKIEKKYTVIYFDARGRGRSGKSPDSRYSVEKDVEDIENLRRQLGYESISLFGHSYGGIVAQSYALTYPDKVKKLILCNTFHSAEGWQDNIDNCNDHIQKSYPEVWNRLMELRKNMSSNTPEWRSVYDPCIGNLYWFSPAKMKKYQAAYKKIRSSEDVFSEAVYYEIIGSDPDFLVNGSMKNLDLRASLNSTKVPTLVLCGRADRVATVKQAVEIQSAIPGSQIFIFEKSGHLPFVEQNKVFIQTVTQFLN
jgi:proline iminopeptidase